MPAPTTTATYLCGTTGGYGGIHAMTHESALWDRAVCGAPCKIASRWGEYRSGLPAALATAEYLCPACAWTVALTQGTGVAELAFWTDHGAGGPSGDLAHRTAAALLAAVADADDELADRPALRLLAQVSAHWPVDLLPEDCAEQTCDHDTAEQCAAGGSVACPACSIRSGPEAGEWEGQYQVPAATPCSALLAVAQCADVAVEVA